MSIFSDEVPPMSFAPEGTSVSMLVLLDVFGSILYI